MTATAVVPLKALAAAKSRLAVALPDRQRRELVAALLRGVVEACRGCAGVDRVLLVAGDEEGAMLGRRLGVAALVVAEPGLGPAIAAADAAVGAAAASLVVAADLPHAAAADLDAVCAAATGAEPVVVVAPARDGGTAALLRRPPRIIDAAFGPGSAAAHLTLARRAGVRAVRLEVAGLADDIDTPAQLAAAGWARAGPAGIG